MSVAELEHRQLKSDGEQPISLAAVEKHFRAHRGSCATRLGRSVDVVAGADVANVGVTEESAEAPATTTSSESMEVVKCILSSEASKILYFRVYYLDNGGLRKPKG